MKRRRFISLMGLFPIAASTTYAATSGKKYELSSDVVLDDGSVLHIKHESNGNDPSASLTREYHEYQKTIAGDKARTIADQDLKGKFRIPKNGATVEVPFVIRSGQFKTFKSSHFIFQHSKILDEHGVTSSEQSKWHFHFLHSIDKSELIAQYKLALEEAGIPLDLLPITTGESVSKKYPAVDFYLDMLELSFDQVPSSPGFNPNGQIALARPYAVVQKLTFTCIKDIPNGTSSVQVQMKQPDGTLVEIDRIDWQSLNQELDKAIERVRLSHLEQFREGKGKEVEDYCVITTAACRYVGLPDHSPELSILRRFRDRHLERIGQKGDIEKYYQLSREILCNLRDADSRARFLFLGFYWKVVVPCCLGTLLGANNRVYCHYKNSIYRLLKKSREHRQSIARQSSQAI